ncbi:MAG: response regulator [Candidatus Synoicihabitans palmerolidicus]|nr:response regulator [Candidatus Synoicihabitans palmerolidicus]
MNPAKRILIVHADAPVRRVLVMLLAEAGLAVRAEVPRDQVVEAVSGQRFDLALIGHCSDMKDTDGFVMASRLRQKRKDLPVVMLCPELELALVVLGIREGLTDVLPWQGDACDACLRYWASMRVVGKR